MAKPVEENYLITIKGTMEQNGENDTVELMTRGNFVQRGNSYYIVYAETEATGYAGCTTTVRVSQDARLVSMTRFGKTSSQLIIEKGIRHLCHYETGYGSISLGVAADVIEHNLLPDGGELQFSYTLDSGADGESVTPRLRAVLDKAGCNYTVQDYTPTSEWARQRQAIGLLMQAVRICFPFGVLLLGGLEIFSVIYAQILARRREFALLRSAGIRSVELYGIAFTECALCLLRGVSLGMLSGVVMLIAIANILQQFWFDLFSGNVMLICVACFAAMGTLAVLSAVVTIRRFPVAYELRHE